LALIAVPVVTFLTYAHVHADALGLSSLLVRLPSILITAVSMGAYAYASHAKPATVERDLDPVLDDGSRPATSLPVVHEQTGMMLAYKWCYTCHSYRPPRSKHCRVCDSCVLRFDHHCPWIMNCVGLHNHKAFMIFLLGTVAHALYEFVFDGLTLAVICNRWYSGVGHLPRETTVLVLVAHTVYLVFILLPVGQLADYHLEVLMKNLTTNEDMNDTYERFGNPFERGGIRGNCWYFWCGPRDPLEAGKLRPELE
jgi:ribosomal protein L40E